MNRKHVTIHKAKPLSGFTTIPNKIAQSAALTATARGVLLYLLSLPESWEIRMDLLSKNTSLSTRPLRRVITELAKAGHMHRFAIPGRKPDTFGGSRWHVFASPADLAAKLAEPLKPRGFIGDRAFLRRSVKRPDVQKETQPKNKAQKPMPSPEELAAFLAAHNLSERIATVYFSHDAAFQSFPANADGSTPPPRDWRTGLLAFAQNPTA